MDFKIDLFMDVLWLGTLCGIISTITIQRVKEAKLIVNTKIMAILSIFINIVIGFMISIVFTNLSLIMSLEVGVVTWIGAETIYEKLKNKNLVKSIKQINCTIVEENNNDNEKQ